MSVFSFSVYASLYLAMSSLSVRVNGIGGIWIDLTGINVFHSASLSAVTVDAFGHRNRMRCEHREISEQPEDFGERDGVRGQREPARNGQLLIVEIFERHGFIWGGKWYHYDTMHFEYRPELLPPGSK